jgi:formylglycine-generating enzyme required for sulfatase activity
MTMSIKSQLVQFLAHLPKTQTVPERRTLLMLAGFDHLGAKIDSFEKNNFVFFSELIELVFSEGQDQLLEFLRALVGSGLVGLEARNKLNDFIAEISALDHRQWNSEFNERKSNQPTRSNSDYSQVISSYLYSNNLKPLIQSQFTSKQENLPNFSTPSQSTASIGEQQNRKLVVPSVPGTKAFEFTVVIVDAQGKEIKCCQEQAQHLTEDLGNGAILEMVYIPEGAFWMGSPESEGKRYSNERPRHSVKIKPFFISKYPVTQAQWKEIASLPEARSKLKLRPSRQGGKNYPVTQISWFDAVEFCDRLSEKTGHKYRLPSEAEWEYACRAGTTTPFHFGQTITSNLANYDSRYPYLSEPKGIYREKTTPVGSFQFANPFGLFDMHGNVWEWCLDHWHKNYDNAPTNGDAWLDSTENQTRVMRGGSWRNDPSMCRSSYRLYHNASEIFNHVGFRIVRSL